MVLFFALFSLFLFPCLLNCDVASKSYLKVAVLGTGKRRGEREEYSNESLVRLLRQIKKHSPELVIFTGHLIQGFEQSTSKQSLDAFKHHLVTFSELVREHLGDTIPLYPILGNHTFVNSQAIAIFRQHFKIENPAPLDPYQLAYSVTTKNTKFTFMASGEYERKFRAYRWFARSMPILDWLEKDVRTKAENVEFQFVIGHEPAYSSQASAGIYTGLDKNPEKRDRFWEILRQNKVLGYFCSHELIYDRSNRSGVWQIISGGVRNPIALKDDIPMFQHFVLIHIPKKNSVNPVAKAFDANGNEWDTFELLPIAQPVHHLRISQQ